MLVERNKENVRQMKTDCGVTHDPPFALHPSPNWDYLNRLDEMQNRSGKQNREASGT